MMWFAKMGPVVPFLSNASYRKILRTPEVPRFRVSVFQSECIWHVLLLSRIPISKRRGKIAMHSLTKKHVEKWCGKVRNNYSRVSRVPLRIFQKAVVTGQKNFAETMLTEGTHDRLNHARRKIDHMSDKIWKHQIDGLKQERRNFIAKTLELRPSCNNSSNYSMPKTYVRRRVPDSDNDAIKVTARAHSTLVVRIRSGD